MYCEKPPTSYFNYYTEFSYTDGTRELVYANFTTLFIGPPLPNSANTSFDYNFVLNVGLLYALDYRANGTRFNYYRNGSIARFQSGTFNSWIRRPLFFWVWCEKQTKLPNTDYSDSICTNGTTIRIADALPDVIDTDELIIKRAIGFVYMEM